MPLINVTKTINDLVGVTGLNITATATQGSNTYPLTATYTAPNLVLNSGSSVGVNGNFTFNVNLSFDAFSSSCNKSVSWVEEVLRTVCSPSEAYTGGIGSNQNGYWTGGVSCFSGDVSTGPAGGQRIGFTRKIIEGSEMFFRNWRNVCPDFAAGFCWFNTQHFGVTTVREAEQTIPSNERGRKTVGFSHQNWVGGNWAAWRGTGTSGPVNGTIYSSEVLIGPRPITYWNGCPGWVTGGYCGSNLPPPTTNGVGPTDLLSIKVEGGKVIFRVNGINRIEVSGINLNDGDDYVFFISWGNNYPITDVSVTGLGDYANWTQI